MKHPHFCLQRIIPAVAGRWDDLSGLNVFPLRFCSNTNSINKTILSSSGSQMGTNISSKPKMMYVYLLISDFDSVLYLFLLKLMIFKNEKSHYTCDSAFSSRRRWTHGSWTSQLHCQVTSWRSPPAATARLHLPLVLRRCQPLSPRWQLWRLSQAPENERKTRRSVSVCSARRNNSSHFPSSSLPPLSLSSSFGAV